MKWHDTGARHGGFYTKNLELRIGCQYILSVAYARADHYGVHQRARGHRRSTGAGDELRAGGHRALHHTVRGLHGERGRVPAVETLIKHREEGVSASRPSGETGDCRPRVV